MLTYAIGFIQNVQLASFAIIFFLMVLVDRENRSFRWFAFAYMSGLIGGLFQFAEGQFPLWFSIPLSYLAAPVGYACIHSGIVEFLGHGRRTRIVSLILLFGSLPLYVACALGVRRSFVPYMDWVATLQDFTLAIQTALSTWVLFTALDRETAWPRRVMGAFLGFYSAVEFTRVIVYLATQRMPEHAAPWVEIASGVVYVVSCSVLPMNFIWMQNARIYAYMGRQMTTDSLTHILNRRGLDAAGESEVARYLRERREFAVALMDIDHFKRLNDTFGHAAGDTVLCEVADIVRNLVRRTDVVGRLGGEEFVLLFPATPLAGAAALVEQLRTTLHHHAFQLGGEEVTVTASFGVASSANRHDISWQLLLGEADQALYTAKHDGRNLARFFHCKFGVLSSEALFSTTRS